MKETDRVPLFTALSILSLSLLLTGATFFLVVQKSTLVGRANRASQKHKIHKIIQTSSHTRALSTHILSELLGLYAEGKAPPEKISCEEALQRLLQTPYIKRAKVAFVKPDSLYIDYAMRRPMAYLGEFENAVIDSEGVIFPLSPIYSPKNLPTLYLGYTSDSLDLKSHSHIDKTLLELVDHLLSLFENVGMQVESLDIARMHHESYGKREIVIRLMHAPKITHLLRLNPREVEEGLINYLTYRELHPEVIEESLVLDLRIDKLAFIEPLK